MTDRSPVDSLVTARKKLATLFEVYTPIAGHNEATSALSGALSEFEAAVREDERDEVKIAADVAQAAQELETLNRSPLKPAHDWVAPPAVVGNDANGSPVFDNTMHPITTDHVSVDVGASSVQNSFTADPLLTPEQPPQVESIKASGKAKKQK